MSNENNTDNIEVFTELSSVSFESLDELNETFIRLCSRVHQYSSLMPEKLVDFMSDKLYEQYKISYAIFSKKKAIKDDTALYTLRSEKSSLVPWRFLFFRNKIGKITDKELKAHFQKVYAEREQSLEDNNSSGS